MILLEIVKEPTLYGPFIFYVYDLWRVGIKVQGASLNGLVQQVPGTISGPAFRQLGRLVTSLQPDFLLRRESKYGSGLMEVYTILIWRQNKIPGTIP